MFKPSRGGPLLACELPKLLAQAQHSQTEAVALRAVLEKIGSEKALVHQEG